MGTRVRGWQQERKRPLAGLLLLILAVALPLAAREKDKLPYGEGLIVNVPLPEKEVEQVVEDVAANGIIRGTKEYNKDEFVGGAKASTTARVFPAWTETGKVFYKVREQAIDPRNFKDSSDVGTLVVRYVVVPQGEKNTVVRIDALFQEDFRRTIHQSSGSVESAEYKDIQEHLEAIEVMKKQNIEALQERQQALAKKSNQAAKVEGAWGNTLDSPSPAPATESSSVPAASGESAGQSPPAQISTDQPSPDKISSDQVSSGQRTLVQSPTSESVSSVPSQTLEEHVKELRKQVERLVKAPGAPLKSAPFHTASTMQSLSAGTEVLILVTSPYWYGVETHDGQHGWIMRDQLEQP